MTPLKISPSIICMDLLNIEKQLPFLCEKSYSLHFDIFDYHFAPSIGLPLELLSSLSSKSSIPIDVHVMVTNVESLIERLVEHKPAMVTIHIEAISSSAFRIFERLRNNDIQVGIALNPITSVKSLDYVLELVQKITVMSFDPGYPGQKFVPYTLSKIQYLKSKKIKSGYTYRIEADGSCNEKNFGRMYDAGAEQFVVGTSGLFSLDETIEKAWNKMESYMNRHIQSTLKINRE